MLATIVDGIIERRMYSSILPCRKRTIDWWIQYNPAMLLLYTAEILTPIQILRFESHSLYAVLIKIPISALSYKQHVFHIRIPVLPSYLIIIDRCTAAVEAYCCIADIGPIERFGRCISHSLPRQCSQEQPCAPNQTATSPPNLWRTH